MIKNSSIFCGLTIYCAARQAAALTPGRAGYICCSGRREIALQHGVVVAPHHDPVGPGRERSRPGLFCWKRSPEAGRPVALCGWPRVAQPNQHRGPSGKAPPNPPTSSRGGNADAAIQSRSPLHAARRTGRTRHRHLTVALGARGQGEGGTHRPDRAIKRFDKPGAAKDCFTPRSQPSQSRRLHPLRRAGGDEGQNFRMVTLALPVRV